MSEDDELAWVREIENDFARFMRAVHGPAGVLSSKCPTCSGRGYVVRKASYSGRVAKDFCFECRGSGAVSSEPKDPT